jgi:hypothetical protein
MGMLECLRAPSTALGVPAAGDMGLSPSWRGVSLNSSRLNCWLFIVLAVDGRPGAGGGARVEKSRQAEDAPDSRAACQSAGTAILHSRGDVTQEQPCRPSHLVRRGSFTMRAGPAGAMSVESVLRALAVSRYSTSRYMSAFAPVSWTAQRQTWFPAMLPSTAFCSAAASWHPIEYSIRCVCCTHMPFPSSLLTPAVPFTCLSRNIPARARVYIDPVLVHGTLLSPHRLINSSNCSTAQHLICSSSCSPQL